MAITCLAYEISRQRPVFLGGYFIFIFIFFVETQWLSRVWPMRYRGSAQFLLVGTLFFCFDFLYRKSMAITCLAY